MPEKESAPQDSPEPAPAKSDKAGDGEYEYTGEDGQPVAVPPGGPDPDEYEMLDVSKSSAPRLPEPQFFEAAPRPVNYGKIALCAAVGLALGAAGGAALLFFLSDRDRGQIEPPAPRHNSPKPPRPPGPPQPPQPPAGAPATVVVGAASTASLIAPFRLIAEDSASGGQCLTLPAKSCADGRHEALFADPADPHRLDGSAQIPFLTPAAGDYSLWIRRWACCAEGDLFIVEVDGGASHFFGNEGANFGKWSWLQLRENGQPVEFALPAGKHVLLVRSAGKSGFRIDQVLVTADPKLAPTGAMKVTEKQEKPEPAATPTTGSF